MTNEIYTIENIIKVAEYYTHYLSEKEADIVLGFVSELTDYSIDTILEMMYLDNKENE